MQRAFRSPVTGEVLRVSAPVVISNCSPEADLADQLLDHKPRAISDEQQKNFIGWDFNTKVEKIDPAKPVNNNEANNNGNGANNAADATLDADDIKLEERKE